MRQDLSPKMKETTFFISENTRMDVWRIFKNDPKVVCKNPPVLVVAFLWSILILRKFFQNPPEVPILQKTAERQKCDEGNKPMVFIPQHSKLKKLK